MRFIDGPTVHRLLDYPGLVAALRKAHRNERPATTSWLMDELRGSNRFLALGAWAPGEAVAVKLVGVFPGNLALEPPQPSVQGVVILFDGTTGGAVLAADGAAMTERKTAADSALGVDLLARQDAATLLVVGAGALAPQVALAHTSVRPSLRRVLIWNRTHERAAALAERLPIEGVMVEAVRDLDAAVGEADIISCVTMASEPLVKGARLRPGAHVDLIGAYTPTMRESDDEVMRRGRLFIDNLAGLDHAGDLVQPLRDGVIERSDICGDHAALCGGRVPGRRSESEITVFKNIGGAHLDLFTIRWLQQRLS